MLGIVNVILGISERMGVEEIRVQTMFGKEIHVVRVSRSLDRMHRELRRYLNTIARC
jgi:hypothetical protein